MVPPPDAVLSILGLTMVGVAGLMALVPVGSCPECPHCRAEKARQERDAAVQAGLLYGAPYCMVCDRHHQPDEDHLR